MRKDGRLNLANRLTATLSLSRKRIEQEIVKSVGPPANPLRYEKNLEWDGIEYAGYTQITSLEMLGDSPSSGVRVGL